MKTKIAIYLAGTIKKGHEKTDDSHWTEENMAFLRHKLSEYEILFLNPAFRMDDLSDQQSVFGRDMVQVFSSNFVFVDARERRGLGVGAEMMWAKLNNIPVLTWAPRNSHYNKDAATVLGISVENYTHPFVDCLSDKVVDSLEEGAQWIQEVISSPSVAIKGVEHIGAAMQYYKANQLKHDKPMNDLIFSCTELEKRVHRPHPKVINAI